MPASSDFYPLVDEALRLQASDLPRSLSLAREAYDIANPDDPHELARANIVLGGLLRLCGGYEEAAALLSKGLEYEPELRVRLTAHIQLGQVYLEQGMKREAETSLEEALRLAEGEELPSKLADIHLNLGNVYSASDPPRALRHYSSALTLYSKLDDETGIATVFANTGVLSQQQGQHEEALATFAQAARLLSSLKEERLRAIVLHRSAISRLALGDHALALNDCEASFAIAREQKLIAVKASILSTKADVLDALGRTADAAETREEATALRAYLHSASE